eukprot:6038178-Amphidinium_carterae.1
MFFELISSRGAQARAAEACGYPPHCQVAPARQRVHTPPPPVAMQMVPHTHWHGGPAICCLASHGYIWLTNHKVRGVHREIINRQSSRKAVAGAVEQRCTERAKIANIWHFFCDGSDIYRRQSALGE